MVGRGDQTQPDNPDWIFIIIALVVFAALGYVIYFIYTNYFQNILKSVNDEIFLIHFFIL
jgi:uncharacterized membrane-anchored protein YhcB (DUF1043 family)